MWNLKDLMDFERRKNREAKAREHFLKMPKFDIVRRARSEYQTRSGTDRITIASVVKGSITELE